MTHKWKTDFPPIVVTAANRIIDRKVLDRDRWLDDLLGEGQLSLYEILAADPPAADEKTQLRLISNHLQRFVRREQREPCQHPVKIDHLDPLDQLHPINDPSAERREAQEAEEGILAHCDPLDAEIVRLRAAGYSRKEVAAELEIDAATVTRRLQAIKKRYFS